jgi:hypothetical protein
VLFSESLDGRLDGLDHLLLDDLLSLGLHQVIAEVLAHVTVDAGRETNDGLGTGVANINADQHGAHFVHDRRELQSVKITANLAVDLAQDVGRFAQVELKSIASDNTLRR